MSQELTPTSRQRLLLALAGFNLLLLNYTLIRQLTLAFADLETAALLMTLAYFSGISLGYLGAGRIGLTAAGRLLPVYLVAQLTLGLLGPLLVQRLAETAGTGVAKLIVFVLVTLGSSSLYSLFLPAAIELEASRIRASYAVEVVGSLAALLALPLLSVSGMETVYAIYVIGFVAIALLLRLPRSRIVFLVLVGGLFVGGFDRLDKRVSAAFYQALYPGRGIERVRYTRYTPYHKIEVLDTTEGESLLFLNAHRQFGPSSHHSYSYLVAEYPARLVGRGKVCLVGCGSMSTVGRIGDLVESIRIVDLDRGVFETSRDFFPRFNRLAELKNWSFVADDAKHFLATGDERFDLIIDDIPPARTRQIALTYTSEFFELVRARLRPAGIFSLPSLTPLDDGSEYGRRMLATLAAVFEQVLVLNLDHGAYFFATDRTRILEAAALRAAIDHPRKDEITILLPDEVRALVRGVPTITVNNMADLMLY